MDLVELPALRRRSLETLSHTALSVAHQFRHRVDAAVVFNAANAPLLPALRLARVRFATHVDGLEWRRGKWGAVGRKYYRIAEQLSVWWSDALIADAAGIQDYYRQRFGADTSLISYGAPVIERHSSRLADLGLEPGGYHLVVARFEPENHVDMIVDGYRRSSATKPLVVVGSAPYSDRYSARVRALANGTVRFLGGVWDQELLDQLYANAFVYWHGHSVGGTNPSLLRAIGAGVATNAFDVVFNREVLGSAGRFFGSADAAAHEFALAESTPEGIGLRGAAARHRAARYDWDDVADRYEQLLRRLAQTKRSAGVPDAAAVAPPAAEDAGSRGAA